MQFLSDNTGKTTGVFIPIEEWNEIKKKYSDIEDAELHIPGWHKSVVTERVAAYEKNKGAADFDDAMNEIGKDL